MSKTFLAKKYWNAAATPMGEAAAFANRKDLINLSIGDPDLNTDFKIIEEAFNDAKKGYTHYTDSAGYIELRAEVSKLYKKRYGVNIDTSEIMITVGACHGMYLALQAVLDPGDEVIIHEPYFTPYYQQVTLAGGIPVMLHTYEEEGFEINPKKLEALITDRTKAIIINSPNNPTGACFCIDTLKAVADIAVKNDLLVLSDEVYDAFTFDEPFTSFIALEGMKQRTVVLQSFSKDYAMTGWRIGYTIAPGHIISCMKDINEGICFSAPSVSQRAALYALRLDEGIRQPIVEEYKKRVMYAAKRINETSLLSVLQPKGSIYVFANIKKCDMSSEEFAAKLLEKAGVLVLPGSAFGKSGEGFIRIACTVSIEILEEAFNRINKFIREI